MSEHDKKMAEKGYSYCVTPIDGSFESLYTKTIRQVASLLRDNAPRLFNVRKIAECWDCISA